MSSGPSLIIASPGTYRALGDGGEAVWRRAAQIRAAIETRLGRRYADLFAIPQAHPDGRIAWQAPFDGVARAWTSLPDAEKRLLQSKVQDLRPDLERLAERLEAPDRSEGERSFGRLIRQALLAPGPETLFSVDSRPVLAFWGFATEGTPGMLLGVAPAPAATLPSWSSAPAAPGWTAAQAAPPPAHTPASPYAAAPPPAGAPQAAAPSGATVAAIAPAGASHWWKWLLVALFLLVLLAVLAVLVKPYLPRWAWDGRYHLPPAVAGRAADDSALQAERARGDALLADLASLREQFNAKRQQCSGAQPGTVPGTVPGGTVVVPGTGTPEAAKPGDTVGPRPADPGQPSQEARRPDGQADPKADGKPEPKADPKADAKPEAKPESKTAPKPELKPEPQRPPPQAARPAKPEPGPKAAEKPIDPVRIPREPGVRFMQGDWRSNTDLTTQGGDDVIRPQYTFDKDGKGKSRIVQKNGVVCEGPAQASRDGAGRLVIQETEPLRCTDGTSYAPSTVTCEPGSDGRAQCQGRTQGGPSYSVQLGK